MSQPDEVPSLDPEFIAQVSGVIKMLGHSDRIKIVEFLQSGERMVGDVQEHIGLSQPVTSQHLRQMKDKGILASRRDGNYIYYSIADQLVNKMLDCLIATQQSLRCDWE